MRNDRLKQRDVRYRVVLEPAGLACCPAGGLWGGTFAGGLLEFEPVGWLGWFVELAGAELVLRSGA